MTSNPTEVLHNSKHVKLNRNILEFYKLQCLYDSFEGQSPHFREMPT